jgi:penicillin-binding protein 1A
MRSDRDKRSDKELEIDEFLSQFDTPLDDFTTDINSYLGDENSTKATAAHTFYGNNVGTSNSGHRTGGSANHDSSQFSKPASEKTDSYTVQDMLKDSSFTNDDIESDDASGVKGLKNRVKKTKKSSSEDNSSKRSSKNSKKDFLGLKAYFRSIKGKSFKQKLRLTFNALFLIDNPNYDPSQGEFIVVNGKKIKNKPKKFSFKKLLRDIIAFGVVCIVAFMLYALVIITMAPRVDADDIYATIEQSSIVYDDEGNQVSSVFYTEDRKLVKYEECPEDLVNAFVAIEDKTFWKHHGFNWVRMIGAVFKAVVGGDSISGTSTITQQLARNVYLADIKSVRSIKRKVLEMYYASQIEACLSKEEIIEAYMNTIYLGYGCYGVSSAAKAYFSKDVKDLTLVECASLAALPQAPEYYALIKYADSSTVTDENTTVIATSPDTLVANDISKDRRDLTLSLMKNQGYITEKECTEAQSYKVTDFLNPTYTTTSDNNSYFKEYMIDEVIEDLMDEYDLEYSDAEKMVYTGGLKIYSTLDSTAQNVVVKELNDTDNFPNLGSVKTNSDGNAVDSSGNVIMYDYDNYFDDSGNFIFGSDEITVNKNGSVTIKKGHRVNIYTTTVDGEDDYSLEFKYLFTYENRTLYTISGGYINIASQYKKLNKNGDLVISADFFKDQDSIRVEDGKLIIPQGAYTLHQKTIQPQVAMTIVEVGTGKIKAMVGGRNVSGQQLYNRCLNPRQPGSSIKPLAVYGAALQKSYELAKDGKTWTYTKYNTDKQNTEGYGDYLTASSPIIDEKMTVNGRVWPKNASGGYSGNQTFRTALQQSLNTCAVKIQMQVGNDYSISMLKKFGITTVVEDGDANDSNAAALALGGMSKGVTSLEMALAYATFPNNGVRNEGISYTKVLDRNGKVLLKNKSKTHRVLNSGVAWIMTDLLKSVVTNGIAGNAWVNNVQSGGKTGTTNNQYDIWFDGFTPTYAAALWIGADTNIYLTSGSSLTASLWGKIMRQIPKACSGTYKKAPSNVVSVDGEYYTKGTEKGRSTYISDLKEHQENVSKIDQYFYDNPDITIDEACAQYGMTYEEYEEAGGTIASGSVSPPKEEEKEDTDTGGGSTDTGGGTDTGGDTLQGVINRLHSLSQ